MPRQRKQVMEAQQVQEREERAWKLRVQGMTQQQIADELGCSQAAISYCLKRVGARHAEQFRDHAEEVKRNQTEQLMRIYEQAMAAWECSLSDEERQTVVKGRAVVDKMTGGIVELPDVTTLTKVGQSGNPALLSQAMKALSDIRSIWGLDAPKRVESVDPSIKWYENVRMEDV